MNWAQFRVYHATTQYVHEIGAATRVQQIGEILIIGCCQKIHISNLINEIIYSLLFAWLARESLSGFDLVIFSHHIWNFASDE